MTDLATSTAPPVLSATPTVTMQIPTNAQPIKTGRLLQKVYALSKMNLFGLN